MHTPAVFQVSRRGLPTATVAQSVAECSVVHCGVGVRFPLADCPIIELEDVDTSELDIRPGLDGRPGIERDEWLTERTEMEELHERAEEIEELYEERRGRGISATNGQGRP